MSKHSRLLVVVADAEHARFIRSPGNNKLHDETAFDSTALHKHSSDLGADRPGAAMHTGSTAHHALAPRHDPKDLETVKFAQFVAGQVNAAAAEDAFDTLVLVAPPHSLEPLRAALDAPAEARIIGTLAKDLVKTPIGALWPHIEPLVIAS
jgi:protein required for attachment to host cells